MIQAVWEEGYEQGGVDLASDCYQHEAADAYKHSTVREEAESLDMLFNMASPITKE